MDFDMSEIASKEQISNEKKMYAISEHDQKNAQSSKQWHSFDKWSFDKRKNFLKLLRHKTNDEIYYAFKKEGIELHPSGNDSDFYAITPNGIYYYFAVKPEKSKRTEAQNKAKAQYRDRYILIVRD